MDISLGKTNYCVNVLIEKGLVKTGNFRRNPHKTVYAYLLTQEGAQEKARAAVRFLHRKIAEYDALQAEIAALRREVDGLRASGLDPGRGAA